jgi:hypothetical protein
MEKRFSRELGMDDSATSRVPVHYLKSNAFRVIHVDGVYGGLTGRGYIHIGIYSDRGPALPRRTEMDVASDGSVLDERVVETREGIVREVEASLIIGLEDAESLQKWLGDKIVQLRAALEDADG